MAKAVAKTGNEEDTIEALKRLDDNGQASDIYWPYPWIVDKVRTEPEFEKAVAKRAANNPEMARLLQIARGE